MYIADLHIHSRYSRATSKECTPEHLDLWARRKGIGVVGTGDFTHPAWRAELKEKLQPAEDGLYVLKKEYCMESEGAANMLSPRFVVTGEISLIYKKYDKVRKVHCLIILPSLEAAEELSLKLEAIGNIHSDGRPILGMDCHDLLEMQLELCPDGIFVPAHIWTPHFSLFGAFSGFNSIKECFGDLSPYIHALETGLSSDPPMNWRVSALDRFQLISNSDAHSPAKLGREANLLDAELSYAGLRDAIEKGKGLYKTIEFFPEEGKYHYDGHRKCGLSLHPLEAEKYHGICPVCGKKLTIGVSHRIEQLADRSEGFQKEGAAAYESLVPLPEVISASLGRTTGSKKVQREYMHMLRTLGSEFDILRNLPLEEIRNASGYLISEGIRRIRTGNVTKIPGFDGEYGVIQLFTKNELEDMEGQMSLFVSQEEKKDLFQKSRQEEKDIKDKRLGTLREREKEETAESAVTQKTVLKLPLNERQRQAVCSSERVTVVAAGPGTGKTHTLSQHMLYLLNTCQIHASQITAVTFTNQAADEMRERMKKLLGKGTGTKQLQIGTFHSIALQYLKNHGVELFLAGESETADVAEDVLEEFGLRIGIRRFLKIVSDHKLGIHMPDEILYLPAVEAYQKCLQDQKAMDFDDLLLEALHIAENEGDGNEAFTYLLVDEFQDISPLQYQLIRAWNRQGRELFVIGDPDQAIYGFRGADSRCFERLLSEYPQMGRIILDKNYRSTPQILTLAQTVISQNPGRKYSLSATVPDGAAVRLVMAENEMEEAVFAAKEINRLIGGIGMLETQGEGIREQSQTRSFDDIAVLYRTHRQARLLEYCLQKEGIPYITAGRDDFLLNNFVRGTVCFFKSLLDMQNNLTIKQADRFLGRLFGKNTMDTAYDRLSSKYSSFIKGKKPAKILEEWIKDLNLKESKEMSKLCKTALYYRSMEDFLTALDTGVESDIKRVNGKQYAAGAVTLMTLHGSKGLEFPTVIVHGAGKGRIPLETGKPLLMHSDEMEEERRLFYVAITRAKEELIITASKEVSCFLSGLPEGLLKDEKTGSTHIKGGGRQMSLSDYGWDIT